jgi:hypothetical protein
MHSCRADKCIPVWLIGVPTVGFGRRRSIVVYLRVDARIVSAGEVRWSFICLITFGVVGFLIGK